MTQQQTITNANDPQQPTWAHTALHSLALSKSPFDLKLSGMKTYHVNTQKMKITTKMNPQQHPPPHSQGSSAMP
jgi:hypothetical protein